MRRSCLSSFRCQGPMHRNTEHGKESRIFQLFWFKDLKAHRIISNSFSLTQVTDAFLKFVSYGPLSCFLRNWHIRICANMKQRWNDVVYTTSELQCCYNVETIYTNVVNSVQRWFNVVSTLSAFWVYLFILGRNGTSVIDAIIVLES